MADDSLILSFDTATPCCSIALTRGNYDDGRVIGSLSLDSGVTHSRRLLGAIDWLLSRSSLVFDNIDGIAVGAGPGSFTGLRIGMSTAKGLAHGSGKPLLGVSSLNAIAASVRSEKLICVAIDARKREVYACFYRLEGHRLPQRCTEPVVITPALLAEKISEPVIMAGDGVDAYLELFQEVLGSRCEKAPAVTMYPSAAMIGLLAFDKFRQGDFLDLEEAVPAYIRASDAELSLVSR